MRQHLTQRAAWSGVAPTSQATLLAPNEDNALWLQAQERIELQMQLARELRAAYEKTASTCDDSGGAAASCSSPSLHPQFPPVF